MKITQKTALVVLSLAALTTAPLALMAMQTPPTPTPPPAPPAQKPPEGKPEGKPEGRPGRAERRGEPVGLEGSMQMIQGCVKKLDKAFETGDMETVLKSTADMEKAVLDAKLGTPEKAGTITDAKEKATFVLGFRKELITLEKSLLDLETAALDGKTDDAKKIFNDTVKPMKKDGHAKYKD